MENCEHGKEKGQRGKLIWTEVLLQLVTPLPSKKLRNMDFPPSCLESKREWTHTQAM